MANKIMDNTSTNMNAITFFSVIVPVLCWVLIQLAIFFKPEATKKKETIENENPNTV
jgi:fucose permease